MSSLQGHKMSIYLYRQSVCLSVILLLMGFAKLHLIPEVNYLFDSSVMSPKRGIKPVMNDLDSMSIS